MLDQHQSLPVPLVQSQVAPVDVRFRRNESNEAGETTDSINCQNPQDLEPCSSSSYDSSDDAPDGGMSAWLVVFGTWCAAFCSFGWVNSVGAFQEYYQNVLLKQYSTSTISWIPSLQIFFMMGLGPVMGALYDKHGPRHLIVIGSILHVFGILMASLSKEYYQILLSQGVCSAIGVSAIINPALNAVHTWFHSKRGIAFGVLATGTSIGGIIFPITVTRLIQKVGFPWAMRACAFIILALLLLTNLTVRVREMPSSTKQSRTRLIKPLREPEFIFLAVGFFLYTYGYYVPINYLPIQAIQQGGMSANLAQYLIPILNAGSLFGRLLAGFFADHFGRYNTFAIVCFLTVVWILALWVVDNTSAAIVAFAAIFGCFSGAYVSLISPLVAQISPSNEIGFRTGVVFFLSALAGLTTNPINGVILDRPHGLTNIKVFAGILCLAGTLFIIGTRIYRVGWDVRVVF